jgi:hypothetical protein
MLSRPRPTSNHSIGMHKGIELYTPFLCMPPTYDSLSSVQSSQSEMDTNQCRTKRAGGIE